MMKRDYLATPLWKKLGMREGSRVLLIGAPDGFEASLAARPAGIRLRTRSGGRFDVIVLFSTRRVELERRFPGLVRSLDPSGRLWVAWPKKASSVPTDLTFDLVQSIGLGSGLVDNKSASVDRTHRGVQFVYRLKDRPPPR